MAAAGETIVTAGMASTGIAGLTRFSAGDFRKTTSTWSEHIAIDIASFDSTNIAAGMSQAVAALAGRIVAQLSAERMSSACHPACHPEDECGEGPAPPSS